MMDHATLAVLIVRSSDCFNYLVHTLQQHPFQSHLVFLNLPFLPRHRASPLHRRQLDFTSGGSQKLSPGWVGGHGISPIASTSSTQSRACYPGKILDLYMSRSQFWCIFLTVANLTGTLKLCAYLWGHELQSSIMRKSGGACAPSGPPKMTPMLLVYIHSSSKHISFYPILHQILLLWLQVLLQ